MCQEIIRLHHGRMEIDSEPGAGTTFRIYLPINEQVIDREEEK
ncbi:hypothetical protein [Paenibacillus sp.]